MRSVTTTDARRHFSRIMREVVAGDTVVVTSRGTPVIEIRQLAISRGGREIAFKVLMTRLRSQAARNLPRVTRDDMYR